MLIWLLSGEDVATNLHLLTESINDVEQLHNCSTIRTKQQDQILIS